jgi:hypothetical protein
MAQGETIYQHWLSLCLLKEEETQLVQKKKKTDQRPPKLKVGKDV